MRVSTDGLSDRALQIVDQNTRAMVFLARFKHIYAGGVGVFADMIKKIANKEYDPSEALIRDVYSLIANEPGFEIVTKAIADFIEFRDETLQAEKETAQE